MDNLSNTVSKITLNISVGYEIQSLVLTKNQWKSINEGAFLVKTQKGVYEGEDFVYEWHFNDPQYPDSSLVVTYDDGDGFMGSISDAWLD